MVDFFKAGYSEGMAKGYLADQQNKRDNNKDVRDEKYLGIAGEELNIKKDYRNIAQADLGIRLDDQSMKREKFGWDREEFGWKREDRAKAQEISDGMAEASRTGGYNGVIDYLSAKDPQKAIEFHSQKLQLDDSIMTNDTLRATLDYKKQDAMFASYGLLGKMAQGISQLPEGEQAAAYQQMLPMIRKIDPSADDTLTPRMRSAGALWIAQATPESIAFKVEKDSLQSRSKADKLYQDYRNALKTGDEAHIAYLKKQVDAEENKAIFTGAQETRYKMQQQQQQATKTQTYQTQLNGTSKVFSEKLAGYTDIDSYIQTLQDNPGNIAAMTQLRYAIIRQNEKGPITESDLKNLSQSYGFPEMEKQIQSILSGNNITLNPKELGNLKTMIDGSMQNQLKMQKIKEQMFDQSVGTEFSDVYNDKGIVKPSQLLENYQNQKVKVNQASKLLQSNGLDKLPGDLKQQAIEALNAYDDPAQKQAVIENIKKKIGQQQQQQQNPQVNPQQGQ